MHINQSDRLDYRFFDGAQNRGYHDDLRTDGLSAYAMGRFHPSCFRESNVAEPILSQVISIIGIQTGDESKGRVVLDILDVLRSQYLSTVLNPVRTVVKVNGGANSGHTVDGLKHNLIPGGITEPTIEQLCIGNGVVADPFKLWIEAHALSLAGLPIFDKLKIDLKTQVSDITDRLVDLAQEDYRSRRHGSGRGSTGRGIAPAFTHEVTQSQLYYLEFLESDGTAFKAKLVERMQLACRYVEHVLEMTPSDWYRFVEDISLKELKANVDLHASGAVDWRIFEFDRFLTTKPFELNWDAVAEEYWDYGTRLADQITDVEQLVRDTIVAGRFVLAEHGQSLLLDKRYGLRPNVSSSHTGPAEIYESCGVPDYTAMHIIGVAKAYETKVGTHVFPTQIPEGHPLRPILERVEFGTTTGRQRMVGWTDVVTMGRALARRGVHDMVLNKFDMLTHKGDWKGDLRICIGYVDSETGGLVFSTPKTNEKMADMRPIYFDMPGWSEDISGIRSFSRLPLQTQDYIACIYHFTVEAAERGHGPLPFLPHLRFVGVGPLPGQVIRDTPSAEQLRTIARGAIRRLGCYQDDRSARFLCRETA